MTIIRYHQSSRTSSLSNPSRPAAGASVIALVMIIGVFVLSVVGVFSFEITRLNLCREQLRSACQAAALAGAASVAGSDAAVTLESHQAAITRALSVFNRNSILGHLQSDAVISTSTTPVQANRANLKIEFLDPNANYVTVSSGNPAGKVVRVSATYGLVPAFGKFIGIGQTSVVALGAAGVPLLDVVLCFDVSGSIDDQTPVTFVKRYWDAIGNRIKYDVVSTASGSLAQGKIFDIIGPPPEGTGMNALWPQDLRATSASENKRRLTFSEINGSTADGLRGRNNTGSPPGNYPGENNASIGNSTTYTDVVVNLDGNNTFAGMNTGGYNFANIGTLVEAHRGNLDNVTDYNNSKCSGSVPVTHKAGFKAKYMELARAQIHPLIEAQQAAQLFFTILNNDTDCHFGLVSFSTNGATSPSGTQSNYVVDYYYQQAGSDNYPFPAVQLNPATGTTNFTQIQAIIPTTVAYGGTNIGDAIGDAVNMLNTKSRSGSRKAIVLFTDGQPTEGNPFSSDPWSNARQAAVAAKNAGIPIYTIGLAQNPDIIPGEKAILNDWDSNPTSGGVAAIAGNGGRFFLVTNSHNLRLAFEQLARQLVQLVRGEATSS